MFQISDFFLAFPCSVGFRHSPPSPLSPCLELSDFYFFFFWWCPRVIGFYLVNFFSPFKNCFPKSPALCHMHFILLWRVARGHFHSSAQCTVRLSPPYYLLPLLPLPIMYLLFSLFSSISQIILQQQGCPPLIYSTEVLNPGFWRRWVEKDSVSYTPNLHILLETWYFKCR